MTHKNEQLVRDNNIEIMNKQGHTKATVTQCGSLNEKEKEILGASPEGLITDPSRKDPHGIFEAKYINVKHGDRGPKRCSYVEFSLSTAILHSLLSKKKPMAQFPV